MPVKAQDTVIPGNRGDPLPKATTTLVLKVCHLDSISGVTIRFTIDLVLTNKMISAVTSPPRHLVTCLSAVPPAVVQLADKSLPKKLVKAICELKNIKALDLSGCPNLDVLPAAFSAHGLGRRLRRLELAPQLRTLPAAAATTDVPPRRKLSAALLYQQRRQAILKLATHARAYADHP
jgi:hypothetical protein